MSGNNTNAGHLVPNKLYNCRREDILSEGILLQLIGDLMRR